MKPQALIVQKRTSGRPSSWAASTVKLMTPSDTMQLTGGIFGEEFSLERRSLKYGRHFVLVDSHRDGMSCVAGGQTIKGVGASRFQQALMVVLCVDKSYMKALVELW